MKKIVLFALLATTAFAESLILENQTSHPLNNAGSRIAVQWASSAKEIQEHNQTALQAMKVKSDTLQNLYQQGKIHLSLSKNAQYFRVLVWLKGKEGPEFVTNWVEIIPGKTYLLKADHLIPAVLMPGMGC